MSNTTDILGFAEPTDYVLTTHGDSMAPAILDGDYLIVRPDAPIMDGQAVVAKVDGKATCRRYGRDGDTIHLRADNPTVEDIEAPADDVKVLGLVVGLARRLV